MSLLGRLTTRSSLEDPGRPLTDVSLLETLGGQRSDAGVAVSEKTALNIVAVYRAVSLLAGSIGSLPLKAYDRESRDEVRIPILEQPSPTLTRYEWAELLVVHLALWGNSYHHKLGGRLSRSLKELRPIHPGQVTKVEIVPASPSNPRGKVFHVRTGSEVEQLTSADILHIPGLSYDGAKGLSPIGQVRQSVGLALAAEKSAARLYANGSMLSGLLSYDTELKTGDAREAKERWRAAHSGVDNAHDIAVLGKGAKFQPVSIPPEDAQFLETRQFQVEEIARLFGIPPHMLGQVSKSTSWGAGIESQGTEFVRSTLRPWLSRIEQRLTFELLDPEVQYAEFKVDGLMRADILKRYQAHAIAVQWGFETRNEVRELENREPLDGLDEPLTPMNMTTDPAAVVDASAEDAPPAGGQEDDNAAAA